MPARLVIGLFHSSGIAEGAVHRLITEGVAPRDIAHRVLKEVGPIPPVLQPELAALEVDPLVIGNARESFARFIRNGETAVENDQTMMYRVNGKISFIVEEKDEQPASRRVA
jgi:hypothetical protein